MLEPRAPGDAVVSGRHLDWYPLTSQPMHVVPVAADTRLDWVPGEASVCRTNGSSGGERPAGRLSALSNVRHGFLCFTLGNTNLREMLERECPGLGLAAWPGFCYEGMNDKGLSVSSLMQPSAPRPPVLNTTAGDRLQVTWLDLPQLLLSNFQTVDEVDAALKPNNTDITTSVLLDELVSSTMGGRPLPALHFVLHDVTGATAVLELFEVEGKQAPASGGSVSWHLLRNPLGVTTNAPRLEEHLAFLDQYKAAVIRQHAAAMAAQQDTAAAPAGAVGAAAGASVMVPGLCTGTGLNAPGYPYCNSAARFVTLAMLKEATLGVLPNPGFPLNPLNQEASEDTAASAVMFLLNRVTVPGSWPVEPSNVYSASESTIVQFIRDHRNAVVRLRTYGNLQWVSLNITEAFTLRTEASCSSGGGGHAREGSCQQPLLVTPLQDIAPPSMPWAVERTAMLRG